MRLIAMTVLAGLLPAPLWAASQWVMTADSGQCEVTFLPEVVDDGLFFVDRGEAACGADLERMTGYALNDEGAGIMLYSTLEGVEVLGHLTRQEDGSYAGQLRSGAALRMDYLGGDKVIPNPAVSPEE